MSELFRVEIKRMNHMKQNNGLKGFVNIMTKINLQMEPTMALLCVFSRTRISGLSRSCDVDSHKCIGDTQNLETWTASLVSDRGSEKNIMVELSVRELIF